MDVPPLVHGPWDRPGEDHTLRRGDPAAVSRNYGISAIGSVGQGTAGEGDEGPGGAGGDQGEDDAAVQREHESERRPEDGELPGLGKGAGQGDGRAQDGSDRGGPGPAEEGAGPAVAAQATEA